MHTVVATHTYTIPCRQPLWRVADHIEQFLKRRRIKAQVSAQGDVPRGYTIMTTTHHQHTQMGFSDAFMRDLIARIDGWTRDAQKQEEDEYRKALASARTWFVNHHAFPAHASPCIGVLVDRLNACYRRIVTHLRSIPVGDHAYTEHRGTCVDHIHDDINQWTQLHAIITALMRLPNARSTFTLSRHLATRRYRDVARAIARAYRRMDTYERGGLPDDIRADICDLALTKI
jgi:hypothetical protein